MNVLHLSAAAEQTGAGKSALATHKSLLDLGVSSRLLFLKSDLKFVNTYSYHKISLWKKIRRLICTFFDRSLLFVYPKKRVEIFSPGLVGLPLRKTELVKWADVIHIHWANHGFIDITEIEKWGKPIVWTLRDMWAFTGGCHQSFDCNNYLYECGHCPALGSHRRLDLSSCLMKRKIEYLKSINIQWVSISKWMKEKANESALLRNRNICIIHSGVDSTTYSLLSKKTTRAILNLPVDKDIILIGAWNIREKYKGFDYAKSVLNKLNPDLLVITFGSGSFHEKEIPQKVIHFGKVDIKQLGEIYNSADLFLGPSIAEAMGKTFVEAQICGLPVVCFDETGPADIIEHKITGYIAKYKDINDLKTGIEYCLKTILDRAYISNRAIEFYDITKCAQAYMNIYEKSITDYKSHCNRDKEFRGRQLSSTTFKISFF